MKKKSTESRIYVGLSAVWGNDDADSTIKVSRRWWKQIQEGAEYDSSAWSWYEGRRYSVGWHFSDGTVSVNGEDGRQCIVDFPVTELIAQITP
jgi:hypothetical protein